MEDNVYLEYDLYMEAAKLDPEKNKRDTLKQLKYDGRTIEINGIDGKPYRCKVSLNPTDLMSGNGSAGISFMRRQLYAGQTADGTPYIRIPPHIFRTYTPERILPLIEHEAEHVRQILNKKKYGKMTDPNEFTYAESRDKKAVIEYTKQYIKKHPIALNKHDRLDYELLADFHAAVKYGRKSYTKALRAMVYQQGSYKRLKASTESVFNDGSPLLKLYESGERRPGPYIKRTKSYIKKMEYALKNTKEAQKHNKNNSQEAANMLGQKEKFSESLNTAAELLETTIETWKNMLKTCEKYEKQNMKIPESDFVAYKVMSITKKITSSFPLVIASFGASVVSTEYRIKFLKEIMKDKPWLKDKEANYRTVYEAYVPLEFDDWYIDDSIIQEGFEEFSEDVEISW